MKVFDSKKTNWKTVMIEREREREGEDNKNQLNGQ